MTINKRKNLPDNRTIYYSIANRGDPRHLDYELSYVVTSTQNARAHSQCKSKLGWPYALQKMTGAKSIEFLLTRLLSANVSEIALSTFRCLVNVYDTMLNAPDCVSERLTMDMDTPQCLTGGLPPALLVARKVVNGLLAPHNVEAGTEEHDATMIAAILWNRGSGPFIPVGSDTGTPRRLTSEEISKLMTRLRTDQSTELEHQQVNDAHELLSASLAQQTKCCCPVLPSKSNMPTQMCLCTSSCVRAAVMDTRPSNDAKAAEVSRAQRARLIESCGPMIETFTLAHETAANTNTTTARGTHNQGVSCRPAHTEPSPEPELKAQPTQPTRLPPKRGDRTVTTQCSDALSQQLELHNTTVTATPAGWSDELVACFADACRCVAKQALAKHPELTDNMKPSVQQRCAAAQEIATCMIQQVEALTSDGTVANAPETGSSKATVQWLMTTLTQIAETCITNELYALHRGAPFEVDGQAMKWGKTYQTTAANWKDGWRAVSDALAEVRNTRGGGASREEMTATSTVEDDARAVMSLCSAWVTDSAVMKETVDEAMCSINTMEVPDLNTTYGENLRMTNGIAKDKYVSAVMPCAVLKMCTHLVDSMRAGTTTVYTAAQYAPWTPHQRDERDVLLGTMFRSKFREATEQAMIQQVEQRKSALIHAATKTLTPLPRDFSYAWSKERLDWIGVPTRSNSVCASLTMAGVSMVGEVVKLIDIKNRHQTTTVGNEDVTYDIMELIWKVKSLEHTGRYVLSCAVEPTQLGLKRADVKDLKIKAENMETIMYHIPDLDEPVKLAKDHTAKAAQSPAAATTSPQVGHMSTAEDQESDLAQRTHTTAASGHPSHRNNSMSTQPRGDMVSTHEHQSPEKKDPPSHRDAGASDHRRAETHTPASRAPKCATPAQEDEEMRQVAMRYMDVSMLSRQLLETPADVPDMMRAILLEKQGVRAEAVMKEIHTALHENGLPKGVHDNCHKCAINLFTTPVAPTVFHSGYKTVLSVCSPTPPEEVRMFEAHELATMAVNCNLSVVCGRCLAVQRYMPEAYYPHTWDACPLDNQHMQALAVNLLDRASQKASTVRTAVEGAYDTAAKRAKASAQMPGNTMIAAAVQHQATAAPPPPSMHPILQQQHQLHMGQTQNQQWSLPPQHAQARYAPPATCSTHLTPSPHISHQPAQQLSPTCAHRQPPAYPQPQECANVRCSRPRHHQKLYCSTACDHAHKEEIARAQRSKIA